ncbi:MAG: hypothetical protein QG670_1636 [Thermoproteota archaeon]|nr:hypothetical protein [Thermoproteota archaeon]
MIELDRLPFETKDYEEQTEIKHKVFREYFDKWVKILGSAHKLNYVDGFAGLGAYHKNEKVYFGSPIIASDVINKNGKEAWLLFIDKDKSAIENLNSVIKFNGLDKLKNLKINVINQDFNEIMDELLNTKNIENAEPTFVFIDPFGFEGIHYETIKKIMQTIKKPEIIINFMFNSITRFLEKENLEDTFAKVFGTEDWKGRVGDEGEREKNIVDFYVSQLEDIKFRIPIQADISRQKQNVLLSHSSYKASFRSFDYEI